MTTNTIFQKLGLAVISVDSGVYHLRRGEGQADPAGDVVGLLFCEAPVTAQSADVKLFLQDVADDVPAARIIYHWQTLDARRFEESGLDPLPLTLDAAQLTGPLTEQRFMRPDGARVRHGVKLATGEVVCYN